MCGSFGDWEYYLYRHFLALVFVGANITASVPGMAKMLAHGGLAIDFSRWDVIAHAIDLIVRKPQVAGGGVKVLPYRVADTTCVDFTIAAILIYPDDPANAPFTERLQVLLGCNIVGLAQRDVELPVRANVADPGSVVVTDELFRD